MSNILKLVFLPLLFIGYTKISVGGDVERDYFVFLTTGKTTQGVAPEEIQKKQAAHIDNFGRLAKLGSLTAAGPCSDPDKVTRGIVVINADSIADAEAMFGPDPYVSEGFMKAELNGYRTVAGKLQLVTEVISMEQSVLVILTQGEKWSTEKSALPQNLWVKELDLATRQRVGFFALLKKQADMLERSQGLPKQPLACFLTPVALELVPTSALSSTEAT